MTLYHIKIRCPHCTQLTFIEEVDTHHSHRTRNLLRPVLHAFICGHCQKSFGRDGDLLEVPVTPAEA